MTSSNLNLSSRSHPRGVMRSGSDGKSDGSITKPMKPTDSESSGSEREFEDYQGELIPPQRIALWRRMAHPATLRGLAALLGGLFVLFTDRSTRTLALVLAVVFVIWAGTEAASASSKESRITRLATAIAIAVFGIGVAVWPDMTGRILSRLVGSALLLAGGRDVFRALRVPRAEGTRGWWLIRGGFLTATGIGLWIAPSVLLGIVLSLFATVWVVTGVVTVVSNIGGAGDMLDVKEAWPRFFAWLEQRPHTADDRNQLYQKLFFEGPASKRRASRFFLLMGFATTIAAFGIASDSTAVVIGAMLIAPLMTPLMGTSLSLVMGWPKRATMSALFAIGGILLAIGLSMVFGAMLPFELDPVTNSQISSRVNPTLVDLIIAVAAGGAGAFALSRPDVSDALPGVAVAIALVPPLAVAGLMLEAGQAEAIGALLLFTTNLVAILLVGAIVFVLTGVVPVRQLVSKSERVRSSAALIGTLAVIVIVVLGTTGERIRAQAYDQDDVEGVVETWIGDRSLSLFSVDVAQQEVELVVVGVDRPGTPEDLAVALEGELGRDLRVVVRWVPEERLEYDGTRD